ncbi:MAG: protein kinase [Deltaproteobacteria bacterium]|nr:protein kinase [Deltaproteobacteria bacterium]
MATTFKLLGSSTELPPQIDRYELLAEIASGGMATVYLARLLGVGGFQRFFAVKRLHPHLGNDESFVEMFLDEARLVAAIRHQNVVPVLEVGAGKSGYYLVMEFIEGETFGGVLSRVVRSKARIPPSVSVKVVLDMLAGLHAAHDLRDQEGHTLGLVHRDVSPQNILIDTDGVSRISDFGVAHATSRLSTTRAGQLKGKVAYMAPEQARGQVVTRSADVFAAGIVLWEALCRKRLFMADNEAVTLNNLMFEPIPTLRQGNPTMPATLEKVLDKALDRDPDKRFATAAEFAEAIEGSARAARMLGTHGEVKTFITSLLGEEIQQRKEALRAHLGDIDRLKQEYSRPRINEGIVPPAAVPPASPLVSSVSSAAMEIPTAPAQESSAPAALDPRLTTGAGAAPQQPSNVKMALIVAAAVSIGVIVLALALRARNNAISTAGPALPASTTPSGAAASTPAPVNSASSAEVLDGQPPATSAPQADTTAPSTGAKRPPGGPKVPAAGTTTPPPVDTTPPKPTGTSTVPPAATDDLKHNPYR